MIDVGMACVPSETAAASVQVSEAPPGRWHKVRNTRISPTALSLFSIAIAVLALTGFVYMAYEDIRPTLIVGAHFEEQEPFGRTDKVLVTVSVSNTGRRSATDVVIRVDWGDECEPHEHSPIRIEPGYRAVPWFEKCKYRPPGGMIRVDVTYEWDIGWFTSSYSISQAFHPDNYRTVDIAPY